MESKFAEAVTSSKNRLYDLRITGEGKKSAYYFLLVNPLKEQVFLKKWNDNQSMELADFGDIINSGFGIPSEELKEEMKSKYGITYEAA